MKMNLLIVVAVSAVLSSFSAWAGPKDCPDFSTKTFINCKATTVGAGMVSFPGDRFNFGYQGDENGNITQIVISIGSMNAPDSIVTLHPDGKNYSIDDAGTQVNASCAQGVLTYRMIVPNLNYTTTTQLSLSADGKTLTKTTPDDSSAREICQLQE